MPLMEFAGDYSWATTLPTSSPSRAPMVAIQPLRPSSYRPTAPLLRRERDGVAASEV